ncbi:MAG TPA: glycosyltransferase [Terrimicrobiaceae bacterium]
MEHLQRRHHFDLWHGVVTYPTGICLVDWQRHAAQRNRYTPYVVRSVGDDILFSENKEVGLRHDPKVRNLIHTIMPKVRMMVALSETMRREYLELGVSAQNLAVIPNAVDIRRFQAGQDRTQTRQLHNLEADRFLFLAVGRNHPQKDYPTLLDATLKLQHISKIPFSLVIAGRDACKLRQQVNDRGLNNIVRLLEIGISKPALHNPATFELPSNEMINLYRAADAFVMSSLLEGFSSALLEAMAAGLPVIVTDSPGCADFVREENSGRIVPPADPAALAETMSLILQSAATRSELSARSFRRASQFDWPVVVDRYLEVYDHVLGAKQSAATLSSSVRRS